MWRKRTTKTRKIDVVKTFLKVHDKIVKIAELLLTFFVFEALNRVAGNQVQFQMIDLEACLHRAVQQSVRH
mgnify:CR=1 FL=1